MSELDDDTNLDTNWTRSPEELVAICRRPPYACPESKIGLVAEPQPKEAGGLDLFCLPEDRRNHSQAPEESGRGQLEEASQEREPDRRG
ncbi:hypothetical protein VTJ04DRAFT_497 [Mycothermus thermophilus]|uniref:uncharacterized protein n=1 Tax=Humicola insolens TaxID=85995 RepID=UPI0037437C6F